MPNRIQDKFAALAGEGRPGFIAYICAGDPNLDATREMVPALEDAGVDLVELGLPFSDPLADGIVNQMAAQRALEAGATTAGVLDCVRDIRKSTQIPIVLYTYMNPVYVHGYENFHRMAADAGVDGLLILDLPPDEAGRNEELRETSGLDHIRLVAPTTPPERIEKLVRDASGFIYYVSREGVTGEQASLPVSIHDGVAAIRRSTSLPVAVGFGISTPEQVRTVGGDADAVVVGSAIVRQIEAHARSPKVAAKVAEFVRPLAAAARG